MDKRKWPWKRKSSERSGGESESSESISSHSERFSDEQQEAMRESVNDNTESPEVTSHAEKAEDEIKGSVKTLTEKLSAALVNVSAKEDLVKQHAKVAEEAVAGWEKAENEVTVLKQQLEAAVQQNLSLEVKNSHLDGALKECVRQLRQARDEQEQQISDALVATNIEWETTRAEFEKRILDLQAEAEAARAENSACVDPMTVIVLEALEKENSSLKQELVSCRRELEFVAIERDLSTQAAETASKLQLEGIKKITKLEAECRKLRKSSPHNTLKSVASSYFLDESLAVSRSESRLDINSWKASSIEANGQELDQFVNDKSSTKNDAARSLEIDMMDDFLEMERLAALPEVKGDSPFATLESASGEASSDNLLMAELDSMTRRVSDLENMLERMEAERSELQNALDETISSDNPLMAELDSVTQRVAYLENILGKMEEEKSELQNALDETIDSLKAARSRTAEVELRLEELHSELIAVYEIKESLEFQLSSIEAESRTQSSRVESLKVEIEDERKLSAEVTKKCQKLEHELTRTIRESKLQQTRVDELQNELTAVYEAKESLESQLSTVEAESRTLSSSLNSLRAQLEDERRLSAELTKKCEEFEDELSRMIQESELQQSMHSNRELKVKQEDLAVAADKLAECQKTIASLGRQLQSLATLEDFFIDTSNLPGFSRDPSSSDAGEMWRLPSNGTFLPNYDSGGPGTLLESYSHLANGSKDSSQCLSSSSSTNHVTAAKNWNSFGKLFSRSKSVAEHENGQA